MAQRTLAPLNLITTEEAAQRLRVNPKTIRRWIAAGKITGYRAGTLIRIDAAELDEFLVQIPAAVAR